MNTIFLPATALMLGARHGLDWDHLAAIMDIVGATTVSAGRRGDVLSLDGSCGILSDSRANSFQLAFLYAAGHAAVVTLLGLAAMVFSVVLPAWIEPIMQRVVGATLLLFGAYISYSLWQFSLGKQDFRMRSRWMLLLNAAKSTRLRAKLQECEHEHPQLGCCGPRSALIMGLIHGIGAETGTQVLLLTTVSGAAGHDMTFGLFLLFCFVFGMFLSNSVIALLVSAGAATHKIAAPFTILTALFTAAFSLWVGALLVLGGNMPEVVPVSFAQRLGMR